MSMPTKKWLQLLLIIPMLLVYGCGQKEDHNQHHEGHTSSSPTSQTITVTFQAHPEKVKANESVMLHTTVKEGDKGVAKAKVEFEIWKSDKKEHEKYPANEEPNGVYSVNKSFSEAGTYNVIVHVNTDKTHQMTEGTFQVEK